MNDTLLDVLEEHLDEAAFLWSQWERALVAPNFGLNDVAGFEERLLAHVDGLVIGGAPAAGTFLIPALEEQADMGRVSVAAYTLLGSGDPSSIEAVRTALDAASPETLPAFQRALELSGPESLPSWLPTLLKQDEPARRALALDVLASLAGDPGPVLSELLRHEEPRGVAAALRVATRLRHPLDRHVLQSCLASPVPALHRPGSGGGFRRASYRGGPVAAAGGGRSGCRPDAPAGGGSTSSDGRASARVVEGGTQAIRR